MVEVFPLYRRGEDFPMLRALRLNPRRNPDPEVGDREVYIEFYEVPLGVHRGQPRWRVRYEVREYRTASDEQYGDWSGWDTLNYLGFSDDFLRKDDPKDIAAEIAKKEGVRSPANIYFQVYGSYSDYPLVLKYSHNWPEH